MLRLLTLGLLWLTPHLLHSAENTELSIQYFQNEVQKLEKVTLEGLKASELQAHYKKLLQLSVDIKQCSSALTQTDSGKESTTSDKVNTADSLCNQLKSTLGRLKKNAIQQLNRDSFYRYKTRQRGLFYNTQAEDLSPTQDSQQRKQSQQHQPSQQYQQWLPQITPSLSQSVNHFSFYLSIALFIGFWFTLKKIGQNANAFTNALADQPSDTQDITSEPNQSQLQTKKRSIYALILMFGFISFITHWLIGGSDDNSQTGYWQGFIIMSMLFLGFENQFSWKSFARLVISYSFAATSLTYLLNFEADTQLPQPLIMDSLFIIAWLVVLLTLTANLSTKVWSGFVVGSVIILTIDSIGFHQLSHQILLTAVTVNIIWLMSRLIKKSIPLFMDQLSQFLQRLRQQLLNDNNSDALPGFPWLRWGLTGAGVLLVLILMTPYLGLPVYMSEQMINGITNGFEIGSISLSLLDIVFGISIFGLLLVLSKFLQIKIESLLEKEI